MSLTVAVIVNAVLAVGLVVLLAAVMRIPFRLGGAPAPVAAESQTWSQTTTSRPEPVGAGRRYRQRACSLGGSWGHHRRHGGALRVAPAASAGVGHWLTWNAAPARPA